jgi:hypothetical protein
MQPASHSLRRSSHHCHCQCHGGGCHNNGAGTSCSAPARVSWVAWTMTKKMRLIHCPCGRHCHHRCCCHCCCCCCTHPLLPVALDLGNLMVVLKAAAPSADSATVVAIVSSTHTVAPTPPPPAMMLLLLPLCATAAVPPKEEFPHVQSHPWFLPRVFVIQEGQGRAPIPANAGSAANTHSNAAAILPPPAIGVQMHLALGPLLVPRPVELWLPPPTTGVLPSAPFPIVAMIVEPIVVCHITSPKFVVVVATAIVVAAIVVAVVVNSIDSVVIIVPTMLPPPPWDPVGPDVQ